MADIEFENDAHGKVMEKTFLQIVWEPRHFVLTCTCIISDGNMARDFNFYFQEDLLSMFALL